jgi:hypothetical protein
VFPQGNKSVVCDDLFAYDVDSSFVPSLSQTSLCLAFSAINIRNIRKSAMQMPMIKAGVYVKVLSYLQEIGYP